MKDEPWLWLEDAAGQIARVSGRDLAARLKELPAAPRLVVLASCQSAGKSAGEALAALGPRLAEAGVVAVLAMQGDISMTTVEQFMPVFFAELQKDGQVDRAVAVARGQVRARPDAWMPVLFLRSESGRLWDDAATASPAQPSRSAGNVVKVGNISNVSGGEINIAGGDVVKKTTRHINTGGGAYVEGPVNTGGGDFVGRDKTDRSIKVGDITGSTGVAIGHGARATVTQTGGASADEIARAFTRIRQAAVSLPEGDDKAEANNAIGKLEVEARKGDQANENTVRKWLTFLAATSADAWEVAINTFTNPISGLSTVFKKIAERAKEEKKP